MMPNAIGIALDTPQSGEAAGLLAAADRRSAALYPRESRHGAGPDALMALGVRFFLARLGGVAVGCGGYVADGSGTGELKRIFVAEAARGQGIGRMVLTALEKDARGRHVRVMRLETGVKSFEAIGMYRGFGYRECGPFGGYVTDPSSIYMEKTLG